MEVHDAIVCPLCSQDDHKRKRLLLLNPHYNQTYFTTIASKTTTSLSEGGVLIKKLHTQFQCLQQSCYSLVNMSGWGFPPAAVRP